MKLGEVLVRKGLITKVQLKAALEAQLIYGGHLGTCLMEQGYLTERMLGNILSEFLDVGFAPAELFHNIPRNVTEKLTERVVETHQVVPFRLQERVLDVAMVDPRDLAAQDAISFAAGCKLRTWVAPEARIFQAMERYYGIPRRLRYVTLCRDIDRSNEFDESIMSAPAHTRPGSGRPAIAVSPMADSPATVSVSLRAALAPRKAAPAATVAAEPAKNEAADPLTALSGKLAAADSVDSVAKLVVEHAGRELDRCIVFLVRSGTALPWQSSGIRGDASRWSSVSFGLTNEPMFGLLNGEELYRGPVPDDPSYRQFFKTLEIDRPEEALLVSAHVDDQLVAIFYGDGGTAGKVQGDDDHYRRLVKKMGLALNMVQVRRSILTA